MFRTMLNTSLRAILFGLDEEAHGVLRLLVRACSGGAMSGQETEQAEVEAAQVAKTIAKGPPRPPRGMPLRALYVGRRSV